MPQENPQNLVRSWNLMTGWATGPVFQDKLAPEDYGRIKTFYNHTWREEQLSSTLDWGKEDFSVYLPESLYVLSSCYLKINVPQGGAAFKKYPGLYAVKRVRLMSNGTEVYTYDSNLFLRDYLESCTEEQVRVFTQAYLGHESSMTNAARTIMVPILLPNSSYMGRAGGTHGHGIFPAFLGQSRLELQISLNASKFLSSTTTGPASVAGECSIMYHEVATTEGAQGSYADLRGMYSIINRRFTELTSGWTEYGTGGAVQHYNQYQPQGTVTEIQLIAVANDADDSRHTQVYILPTSITITVDSVVVKSLDTPEKVKAELWQNGFHPPADFTSPGRLCFAAHCSGSDHMFSGGYNMRLASNVDISFTFAAACRYKVVSSAIQRVTIDDLGKIRASLE